MIDKIIQEVKHKGADIAKIVDISKLSFEENRGYKSAILIVIGLPKEYIIKQKNYKVGKIDKSIYSNAEKQVDCMGEWLEDYLITKGHKAFAQSEKNILKHGYYDESIKCTVLPNKKIANMAGIGWIGKNNLICTEEYGSAICMCSVLTDIEYLQDDSSLLQSKCEECDVCKNICPTGAISGVEWEKATHRDEILDVHRCIQCLKCMIECPNTYGN